MGFMDEDENIKKEKEAASLKAFIDEEEMKLFRFEPPKTRLKFIYQRHFEQAQKIAELEVLKKEWEEEELALQEKEKAIEWVEKINTVLKEKNIQIQQIKLKRLAEIIEQNREFLME